MALKQLTNYDFFKLDMEKKLYNICIIQGGPKVSLHTLGLITPPCFIFEGCCFADGTLYLLVRGFRRQNLRI